MKSTRIEYLNFFEKWLHYQFPRVEDDWNNYDVIRKVAKIVATDDDASEWGNRDCWTMYDIASK